MSLGAFSVSLSVSNLTESKAFYEKIGFQVFAGDESQNYLIMKNGSTNIGLFQGMFEHNILTFNPGWDNDARPLQEPTDVRELHKKFTESGVTMDSESFPQATGPASFVITDPDGNQILFDQHV